MAEQSGTNHPQSEMLSFFRQEVEDRVQALIDHLLRLEGEADSSEALEVLMRSAHSIKGAARVVQLMPIVQLAHALEDCFVKAQRGELALRESWQIDALLEAVDWLTLLYQQSDIVAWLQTQTETLGQIQAGVDALTAGSAIASAEPGEPQSPPVRAVADRAPTLPEPSAVRESEPELTAGADAGIESDPATWSLPEFVDASLIRQFVIELQEPLDALLLDLKPLHPDQCSGASVPDLNNSRSHSEGLKQMAGALRVLQLPLLPDVVEAIARCLQQHQAQPLALTLWTQQWPAIAPPLQRLQSLVEALKSQEPRALSTYLQHWMRTQMPDWQAWLLHLRRAAQRKTEATSLPPDNRVVVTPSVAPEPTASLAVAEASPVPAVPATPALVPPAAPPPAGEAASAPSDPNRVVRVNGAILNRLMALAGETLVEANWLQPFADSLKTIRRQQFDLDTALSKLQETLQENDALPGSIDPSRAHLVQVQQMADQCRHQLTERIEDLELYVRRSMGLSDRLYQTVISSNMRPFSDGAQRFPRLVRDLSRRFGKQVEIQILGQQTPVDRDVLEKLEVPLTHLLQNALDHGIETAEEREKSGKPARGMIRLEAMHRGGMLSISLSDDGRGIDLEKLRKKVVERGYLDRPTAARLNSEELMEFLFLPGFSTAKTVTDVSGRGVGLDIVQTMVQDVGGVLRANTKFGSGTSFHLQLPLTLSVIRTLLVTIADEPYAFPLSRIDRVVRIEPMQLLTAEGRQYFQFDEQNIGLVSAREVLDLGQNSEERSQLDIVLISDRSHTYGLIVDRFLGEKDLVIRPLDPRLGKVKDVSAAAQMEDGSPILILDVEDLIRSIEQRLSEGERMVKIRNPLAVPETLPRKRVLVVDDSITVREVERKLLENRGYDVEVAVNGVDGWNAVRSEAFDLVVSDIDMPRMNGFELVAKIKNDEGLRDLPVIIVSYKEREEDRLRGLEVGADYYLTKSSFQDDSLVQAVVDLIGEAV